MCLKKNRVHLLVTWLLFLVLGPSSFQIVYSKPEVDLNITAQSATSTQVRFVHAALATNLSVQALLDISGRIVLNVSWVPPTEGEELPESYNLHVDSLDQLEKKYYIFLNDKFVTNATIPPQEMLDFHPDFYIRPGDTYNITLYSNPHNGENAVRVNFTIPDCVGSVCDCRSFYDLPIPRILICAQDDDILNITWTYSGHNLTHVKITNFNIGITPESSNLASMKSIALAKYAQPPSLMHRYSEEVPMPRNLSVTSSYRLQLLVENIDRGCWGRPANCSLQRNVVSPDTSEARNYSLFLIALVLSITFVIACSIVFKTMWHRCDECIRRRLHRDSSIVAWQVGYKANQANTDSRMQVEMTANLIYVDFDNQGASAQGHADKFEVSLSQLQLGREIGRGAFGRVYLAYADSIGGIPGRRHVAVKKLSNKSRPDEVDDFLAEIAMLKTVGHHPNIVTLLGCVTLSQPYCIVMEYLCCGDLMQYLRQLRLEYERKSGVPLLFISTRSRPNADLEVRYVEHKVDSDESYVTPNPVRSRNRPSETECSLLTNIETPIPTTSDQDTVFLQHHRLEYSLDPAELQNFAIQIARGMAHLEWKEITHRDLAARNVLITADKTLKISDFGLSRFGVYVKTKKSKVPLRWLSVEAMRDSLYSSKSDVWAFAVVLWEIGTLGGFPYPTVADQDMLDYILDGRRLNRPDNCTEELYSLMQQCWSYSVDMRPTFQELVFQLDKIIARRRVYVDFENLRPDFAFPPTEQEVSSRPETGREPEFRIFQSR